MLPISHYVRVTPGTTARLAKRDPNASLGVSDGKRRGRLRAERSTDRIAELQELLWAEGRQSLLVVLQGMDASGKDGATRRLLTGVNPQGCSVTSFKTPSETELGHDYLRRVHQACPPRGSIAIFNRSHYEDVATTQVLGLIDAKEASRRAAEINEFEHHLTGQGTTIVKIFLHLSKEEQRRRLQERIDRPEKHWKMDLQDLENRRHWDEYQRLYDRAIGATSTDHAPWHVVPADRKWLRDVAVSELVVEALERMNPAFPPPRPELHGIVVK